MKLSLLEQKSLLALQQHLLMPSQKVLKGSGKKELFFVWIGAGACFGPGFLKSFSVIASLSLLFCNLALFGYFFWRFLETVNDFASEKDKIDCLHNIQLFLKNNPHLTAHFQSTVFLLASDKRLSYNFVNAIRSCCGGLLTKDNLSFNDLLVQNPQKHIKEKMKAIELMIELEHQNALEEQKSALVSQIVATEDELQVMTLLDTPLPTETQQSRWVH